MSGSGGLASGAALQALSLDDRSLALPAPALRVPQSRRLVPTGVSSVPDSDRRPSTAAATTTARRMATALAMPPHREGSCHDVSGSFRTLVVGGAIAGKLRKVVADERFWIEVDFFCVSTNEAAAEGGRWERGPVISLDGGQRARRHSSALRHCSDRETLGLSCCSELCADVHARSPWLRSGR